MSQPPSIAPSPNRKTRPLIASELMLRRPSPPRADTTSNTPPVKARTNARRDSSLCTFKGIFNFMVSKSLIGIITQQIRTREKRLFSIRANRRATKTAIRLVATDLLGPARECLYDRLQCLPGLRVVQFEIAVKRVLGSGEEELWLVDRVHVKIDQYLA